MAEKNSKGKKRKWEPVVLDDPLFFAGEMDGFVSLEVMEDYDLEELTGIGAGGPVRKKKVKEQPLQKDNDKQTDTTLSTQLEKGKKKDQQTKKKKKRKKKNKAQSKDQSEEQNKMEILTDNRMVGDPQGPMSDMSAWEVLGVPKELQRGLSEQSFTTPTPIQTLSLPPAIFHRRDIIGVAETGSGKTLAFGIPILTHILGHNTRQEAGETTENTDRNIGTEATEAGNGTSKVKKPLLALIMTPTRELAIQIKNHLNQAAKHTSLEIVAVVGGMAPQKQQRLLHKCPEVIVATPGRLWDLISEGEEHVCHLEHLRYLVIDEADRMVEQGHFQELSSILELIHRKSDDDEDTGTAKRKHLQKFIFSATLTLPKSFKKKGKEMKITGEEGLVLLMDKVGLQKNSCKIIDVTNKRGTVETLTEAKISCSIEEKDLYLYYFLSRYPGRTLVFSNTVDCVRRLGSLFRLLDFDPWVLHASMQQRQRLKNLDRPPTFAQPFHVIPHSFLYVGLQLYIHRSGRTARASREGLSVVLVGPEEMGSYRKIMKALNGGNELDSFPVDVSFMSSIKKRISLAKQIDKEEHKFKRKKSSNDWILASAKAMDIEVDEDLLEDLGDQGERKVRQVKLKQIKAELAGLLKTPLIPAGFSGKYPTKTGSLMYARDQSRNEVGR
ncbi:ATP-dependent RNA helicase ddx24-like [Stylophora pistillata]|uniref:ATP-dependent RNA helicase ddx24-like n=1 Tax=Stylophora pistillata TaxID=50429 RepID=UPI000C040301|nr:ATP-dependent RNA helicase ddx24-like [Stylophora pistillata]